MIHFLLMPWLALHAHNNVKAIIIIILIIILDFYGTPS